MAVTTIIPPAPSLLGQLKTPRKIGILIAIAWLPLMIYVMGAGLIDESVRNAILLPAVPAVMILYVIAMTSWKESWIAVLGASLVFFWLFMAITVPFLPLADQNSPGGIVAIFSSGKDDVFHLLGTDHKGRDLLSRVIWGCQRVVVWGISATFVAYIIGTIFGLIAGYLSGWWDEFISFFGNVLLSFPVMVLFIVILNYLGPSGFNIVIAVTFASAPAIMRIVRGLALDIKTRDYVFAAQTRGESALWIMVIELLPNVRGPIIVDACLRLGYTTVAITTLTFLGLGLQPPDPDWGLMIREAAKVAMLWKFSYMLLIPALAVSSLILGFNLMADGLREMSLRD